MSDYPTLPFTDAAAWRTWLAANHTTTDGLWLRLYKKGSGVPTVSYAEALDEALCFGWIDGQKRSYDAESFLQKFTPRRKASLWSKRNIEHIARLTEAGQMTPAGIAEVERAQSDGRWQAAYDAPSQITVPDDLKAELSKRPATEAYFEGLSKTNRYSVLWQLQTAKTAETRARRLEKVIAMLEEGRSRY